jgi:hypothetical protein
MYTPIMEIKEIEMIEAILAEARKGTRKQQDQTSTARRTRVVSENHVCGTLSRFKRTCKRVRQKNTVRAGHWKIQKQLVDGRNDPRHKTRGQHMVSGRGFGVN